MPCPAHGWLADLGKKSLFQGTSTKRSSMAFLVQMGLPLSSDDVVVDVVVDGDGDGDERHRQSLVSIATVRASNSIP